MFTSSRLSAEEVMSMAIRNYRLAGSSPASLRISSIAGEPCCMAGESDSAQLSCAAQLCCENTGFAA